MPEMAQKDMEIELHLDLEIKHNGISSRPAMLLLCTHKRYHHLFTLGMCNIFILFQLKSFKTMCWSRMWSLSKYWARHDNAALTSPLFWDWCIYWPFVCQGLTATFWADLDFFICDINLILFRKHFRRRGLLGRCVSSSSFYGFEQFPCSPIWLFKSGQTVWGFLRLLECLCHAVLVTNAINLVPNPHFIALCVYRAHVWSVVSFGWACSCPVADSTLHWGCDLPTNGSLQLVAHPSQLYQAFEGLLLFVVLLVSSVQSPSRMAVFSVILMVLVWPPSSSSSLWGLITDSCSSHG